MLIDLNPKIFPSFALGQLIFVFVLSKDWKPCCPMMAENVNKYVQFAFNMSPITVNGLSFIVVILGWS